MKKQMSQQFELAELLALAQARMSTDLEAMLIKHPGELGISREEVIRQFLRAYLPKRFEISSGFVFDCTGRRSKQIDIIIADSLVSPRFDLPGGTRLYPCES